MRFDRQPGITPVPQPSTPPGAVLNEITDDDYSTDPALALVRVFELEGPVAVAPLNNELRIHTWGNDECCLPKGTTSAHVYAIDGTNAARPPLTVGQYLLLEEVRGPATGSIADADPVHRQVVKVVRIHPDPAASGFA